MGNRLFSDKHIWIDQDEAIVFIGITEYAQEKLGSIMFLNLPEVGEKVEIGERFGDIESIKTVSDLFSPIDGEVIKVNEDLVDEPERINEAPYDSWFIKVKTTAILDDLMDEKTYLEKKEQF